MFITNKILIKSAGNKGGVFASKKILAGEISPYIETPEFDYSKLKKTIVNYYWYGVCGFICGIGLGYTSLYNHSKKNNAEFIINKKRRLIKIFHPRK